MENIPPIEKYIRDIDILNQTADQIIKDLGISGIKIRFSGDKYNAYEELFNQIDPEIDKMLNTDRSRLMQVLYRIDINEDLLKRKLRENSSESTSAVITELIIKRELQKVVIRNFYKQ
jgi:hypothetical protein